MEKTFTEAVPIHTDANLLYLGITPLTGPTRRLPRTQPFFGGKQMPHGIGGFSLSWNQTDFATWSRLATGIGPVLSVSGA